MTITEDLFALRDDVEILVYDRRRGLLDVGSPRHEILYDRMRSILDAARDARDEDRQVVMRLARPLTQAIVHASRADTAGLDEADRLIRFDPDDLET